MKRYVNIVAVENPLPQTPNYVRGRRGLTQTDRRKKLRETREEENDVFVSLSLPAS